MLAVKSNGLPTQVSTNNLIQKFVAVPARSGRSAAMQGRRRAWRVKAADEDAQVLNVVLVGASTNVGEQLAMGDNAAGIAGEQRQKVELLAGALDRLTSERDLVAREIEAQVAAHDFRPRCSAARG